MSSPDENLRNAENAESAKERKRGRRKFRHEIQKRMWKVAAHRVGMMLRPAQLHEAARTLTQRYMHNLDHAPARVAPHLSPEIPARASERIEPGAAVPPRAMETAAK